MAKAPSTKKLSAKKLLIVEDESVLRQTLADRLVHEGFKVLRASDGEEGLALALKEKPDCIILDIIMPKMDGVTMIVKLRKANDWGASVPVLLLTNLNVGEKITADIPEPTYYLVKTDWSLGEIVAKIKDVLRLP